MNDPMVVVNTKNVSAVASGQAELRKQVDIMRQLGEDNNRLVLSLLEQVESLRVQLAASQLAAVERGVLK